jgi:hypothetical protein
LGFFRFCERMCRIWSFLVAIDIRSLFFGMQCVLLWLDDPQVRLVARRPDSVFDCLVKRVSQE